MMIKADILTRKYGDFKAVDQVSFEIAAGSIVGLLGHNGAGKTTIMKMLTGFLEPSSGRVVVDNTDLWLNLKEMQRSIGYLPENSPLYPEMTVVEYLEFAAALRGVPDSKRLARIAYAVERTKIQELIKKPISTLSRGYKQRLGVAQAILNEPRILVLDEPTNGLDPAQIVEMRALIKELAAGSTILLSTHILQEVQAVCGRVLIVSGGKLALDAELSSLQNSGRIRLKSSADPECLNKISGELGSFSVLRSSQESEKFDYSLDASGAKDLFEICSILNGALLERGHKVYAIHPELQDLEAVFGEISAGSKR